MKFWKNWSYWIRGGVISFVLVIGILLFSYFYYGDYRHQDLIIPVRIFSLFIITLTGICVGELYGNNWRPSRKGGLFLSGIFLILFLWNYFGYLINRDLLSFSMGVDVLTLPFRPPYIQHNISFFIYDVATQKINIQNLTLIMILGFLFFFIAGTVIGWLYEKIKKRKKNSPFQNS